MASKLTPLIFRLNSITVRNLRRQRRGSPCQLRGLPSSRLYGRPGASLYIRKHVCHSAVTLDVFTSEHFKYADIALRVHGNDASVVSISVRPVAPWDHREFIQVRRHCVEIAFLYGYVSVHYEAWGDSHSGARGEAFFDVMVVRKLVALVLLFDLI